jgi:hypothetical protein
MRQGEHHPERAAGEAVADDNPAPLGFQHDGGQPMRDDILTLSKQSFRGTASNPLLRMYDHASRILSRSSSQQERARADKALQRIATELNKRHVQP